MLHLELRNIDNPELTAPERSRFRSVIFNLTLLNRKSC